ncbi:MAG: protein-glutamine gamma-glutamyltransferase [Bacilli bacterium]
MILINNTIITPTLLKDGTTAYDEKQRILAELQISTEVYAYTSLNELSFDVSLRHSMTLAAKGLNESRMAFRDFHHSYCNPTYWTRQWNGGFQIRPGVAPHQALLDIYTNGQLYGTECATAIIIMMYYALLQVIPVATFDQLFAGMQLYTWNHDSDLKIVTKFQKAYVIGDVVYFKNPQVHPATPEWQGENTVYLGADMFYGHGTSIANSENIIWKLNIHRIPYATISAYISNQVTHINASSMAIFADTKKVATVITQTTQSRSDFVKIKVGNNIAVYQ